MISKISRGDNFQNLLDYLLRDDKQPEILPSFMSGTNAEEHTGAKPMKHAAKTGNTILTGKQKRWSMSIPPLRWL